LIPHIDPSPKCKHGKDLGGKRRKKKKKMREVRGVVFSFHFKHF